MRLLRWFAANTYYYLSDGLGSTMKTVDATGTVVNGYTYDVYGKKTSSTGSQANEFDFAGQQTDATGLQYLRARYMDPETGTFLSRDPMSGSPTWNANPFGYVGANPASRVDPSGLWCVGPACIDSDGASVGGHEIVEGARTGAGAVGNAANAAAAAAWNALRAAVNADLSGIAKGLSAAYGGSCKGIGDGIIGCGGLGALLDALHIGGKAFTLGNVILTREKSIDGLGAEYLDHEIRHADQWALFGLGALSAGMDPLAGQAVMFIAYLMNVAVVTPFGGGVCQNVFEIWAGLAGGNYSC